MWFLQKLFYPRYPLIVLSLYTEICKVKNQKQHLIHISLDLEKAYGIKWRTVLKIIHDYGINGLFLKNFLENLTIQVRTYNELSNIYPTKNGHPQGSVISIIMLLLVINNIFNHIPKPTSHLLFADDLNIHLSSRHYNNPR